MSEWSWVECNGDCTVLMSLFINTDGVPAGQYPFITRFTKGVFNIKSAVSKCNVTWVVKIVITHISKIDSYSLNRNSSEGSYSVGVTVWSEIWRDIIWTQKAYCKNLWTQKAYCNSMHI